MSSVCFRAAYDRRKNLVEIKHSIQRNTFKGILILAIVYISDIVNNFSSFFLTKKGNVKCHTTNYFDESMSSLPRSLPKDYWVIHDPLFEFLKISIKLFNLLELRYFQTINNGVILKVLSILEECERMYFVVAISYTIRHACCTSSSWLTYSMFD